MQIAPVSSTPHHAVVHDLAALKRGNLDPAEQRAAVAGQFEAILLRQFLQESIGSMMGGEKGGGGSGGGGGVYSYMLTDTLADKLSQGNGMGIAPMIAKQLTPRGSVSMVPPPTQRPKTNEPDRFNQSHVAKRSPNACLANSPNTAAYSRLLPSSRYFSSNAKPTKSSAFPRPLSSRCAPLSNAAASVKAWWLDFCRGANVRNRRAPRCVHCCQ